MPDATTYDQLLARFSEDKYATYPMHDCLLATGTGAGSGAGSMNVRDSLSRITLPTLPSGISKYRAVFAHGTAGTTINIALIAKMVKLGSLDIGTNVFTAGSAMPTVTELGVSNPVWSALLAVVSTAFTGAAAGSLAVTYTNQDGTTGQSASLTFNALATLGQATFIGTLATGDFGVRAVTGAVRSGGTPPTGAIDFYGMIPLTFVLLQAINMVHGAVNLASGSVNLPALGAGDQIGMVIMGNPFVAGTQHAVWVSLIGENS